MDPKRTPLVVEELRRWLVDAGFTIHSEIEGGMGGSEQIFHGSFKGNQVYVTVTSDRGHWTVGVRIGKMKRSIRPSVWMAYLRQSKVKILPLAEEVSALQSHIADFVDISRDPTLETKLVAMGREFMSAQFGKK